MWLKLNTGEKRSSKSGGLNAVLPLISENEAIRLSFTASWLLRENWSFARLVADEANGTGVGTRRGSITVSEIIEKLMNQSLPNTGRSPLSQFCL